MLAQVSYQTNHSLLQYWVPQAKLIKKQVALQQNAGEANQARISLAKTNTWVFMVLKGFCLNQNIERCIPNLECQPN